MFVSLSLPIGLFPPRNFEYSVPGNLEDTVKSGTLVRVAFRKRMLWGVVEAVSREAVFQGRHEEISSVIEVPEKIQDNLNALVPWLANTYFCSLAQAAQTATPLKFFLKSRGFQKERALNFHVSQGETTLELTPAQKEAFGQILKNFRGERKPTYLWGPTGSGKTFVMLELINELLKERKSVIYLVPEITLTPQFVEIFTNGLPRGVSFGVWSSKTPQALKRQILNEALAGGLPFVLGTRSAVFLPLPNLGAIILDEEQDSSFKQENPPPSYHAREAAIFRAEKENALALFASATPSLECYQAIQDGSMIRVEVPERYGSKPMPKITLLREDSPKTTEKVLLEIIKTKIGEGGQVLIFHNRRGWARTLKCKNCKKGLFCQRCDIPFILHKNGKDSLKCHHCGVHKNVPSACPDCGKPQLEFQMGGLGTQKIAETIRTQLGVKVLRLDKETSRDSEAIFSEYKKGEVPVLVGTKLVTKGWHYPNVNFVGVLHADQELVLPDFRSCERAFQSLVQVAGRAGRGEYPGEALMITSNSKHYLFESLVKNQWGIFYEKELALRRELNLPPFSRLLLIEIRSKDKQKALEASDLILSNLKKENNAGAEIAGAAPSYFAKIRNIWRYQLVLKYALMNDGQKEKNSSRQELFRALEKTARVYPARIVKIILRPDPYNLF